MTDELLYVVDHDGPKRLCVPKSLNKEVLQLAHDY
jgi:hypothetical protein